MNFDIIITNDDGYSATGIIALKEALQEILEKENLNLKSAILAPDRERSASGHGLTLSRPLHIDRVDDTTYKSNGTPTDCAFLAINALSENKPKFLFSGINIGSNMGDDTTYSGTLAAAIEGTLQGLYCIAFSQVMNRGKTQDYDFTLAKYIVQKLVPLMLKNSLILDKGVLLNVNIPDCKMKDFKGFKITNTGQRIYQNDLIKREDPRGKDYYWIGLEPLDFTTRDIDNDLKSALKLKNLSSDFIAVSENYASITPIRLDLSAYETMQKLQNLCDELNKN